MVLPIAGKHVYSLSRMVVESGFDQEKPFIIGCGNAQTVCLFMNEKPAIHMEHKDVGVHPPWIRQETMTKRLIVEWKNTTSMPVDDLTKSLPC